MFSSFFRVKASFLSALCWLVVSVAKNSVSNTVSARLACVRHAASVRPEPGSNSPKKVIQTSTIEEDDSLIVF